MFPRCRLATARCLPSGAKAGTPQRSHSLGVTRCSWPEARSLTKVWLSWMKTIDLPSGAQLPCEPLVTNFGSEPSRFISQISGKPPRSVV